MKRLISAIAIIAVSFSISLWGYIYEKKALDEIVFTAENDPENIEKVWLEKKDLLSVLLKSNDIESIEEQLYTEKDPDKLIAVVNSIKDGEQFNLGNIF